jgi:prepilin-type N-terminal cleavage/methylation domain-containing protein
MDARKSGFTLIELLVVIGIIVILVAALLPAFSVIRTKARYADASAQFLALRAALEAYRGESALDGAYPPSAGDNGGNSGLNPFMIADPHGDQPTPAVAVTGAHLLVHALVGADLLGPAGFRDLNRNGKWADDTHRGSRGLYELDKTTGEPLQTRYGGQGRSYVDDKMRARIKSLNDLQGAGVVANLNVERSTEESYNEPLFVDPWDRPILYYRANPAARPMIATANAPGVYRVEDNGLISGAYRSTIKDFSGIDFGPGKITGTAGGLYHALADAAAPTFNQDLNLVQFDYSFARFIRDKSIKAANQPVQKDSYLLISAGPDARYGTTDDVTNWVREGAP